MLCTQQHACLPIDSPEARLEWAGHTDHACSVPPAASQAQCGVQLQPGNARLGNGGLPARAQELHGARAGKLLPARAAALVLWRGCPWAGMRCGPGAMRPHSCAVALPRPQEEAGLRDPSQAAAAAYAQDGDGMGSRCACQGCRRAGAVLALRRGPPSALHARRHGSFHCMGHTRRCCACAAARSAQHHQSRAQRLLDRVAAPLRLGLQELLPTLAKLGSAMTVRGWGGAGGVGGCTSGAGWWLLIHHTP